METNQPIIRDISAHESLQKILNLVTIYLTRLIVLLTFGRPCQPAHFVYQQWKGLFEDGFMVLACYNIC